MATSQKSVSPLSAERLLSHNVLVASGTMAAGILGFGFQVVISHRLAPAEFGGVFAIVTLLTLIGLPGAALTLMMAREVSRDRARGQAASSGALLQAGNRVFLLIGCGIGALFIASSPLLAPFLHLRFELLVVAAGGMPFGLALPFLLGELQGEQRFLAFSLLTGGQAVFKLAGAVTLGTFLGPVGVIAGLSLATAAIYVIALRLLHPRFSVQSGPVRWRPHVEYLAVVLPSTLALAAILSADVLLVKHFFPERQAGEYAAVAALGRAIFWGAAGVAGVLFPKVIVRETQGRSGLQLIAMSMALVAAGGTIGLGALALSSKVLLRAFAGDAYAGGAAYLPWYALGMTLLGAAAILMATHQSRGRPAFLGVAVPIMLLEPALIAWRHQSLTKVVAVVDLSMALLVVGLAALLAVREQPQPSEGKPVSEHPLVGEPELLPSVGASR